VEPPVVSVCYCSGTTIFHVTLTGARANNGGRGRIWKEQEKGRFFFFFFMYETCWQQLLAQVHARTTMTQLNFMQKNDKRNQIDHNLILVLHIGDAEMKITSTWSNEWEIIPSSFNILSLDWKRTLADW